MQTKRAATYSRFKKEEYHLFVPKRDAQFAVWHGYVKTKEQYQEEYKPDHLHYSNEILSILKKLHQNSVLPYRRTSEFCKDLNRGFNVDTRNAH